MNKSILLTNQNDTTKDYSITWDGGTATIVHNLGNEYMVEVTDTTTHAVLHPTIQKHANRVEIAFDEPLTDLDVYSVAIFTEYIEPPIETPTAEKEYYSGTQSDVLQFCKSLNISEDKLNGVSHVNVVRMQEIVDDAIDGYLNEYYFTPLHPFSQVQPDGSVKKVFPGKIRFLALQWTAGLLLQTEFQNVEPNINEQATKFVEEAKKEMQQIVDYSTRIPGQRRKHPSPTMPPNLAPSKTNEFQL